MTDQATSFIWDPTTQTISIVGEKSTMTVKPEDAYRLAMVCLAADPSWEMLPADWRNYLTTKK